MNSGSPSTEVPPSQGLVAGKYQLTRLIGKGGMGSVWEGQHFKLLTKVAIKFIEIEHAVSQEARSRFEKEAMAAATIQSKHAIQIFDHGVTNEGIPYIVMEMLVGESLERRVERLSRMSLQETAKFILQVSRALARAHERGIIHRDLKPDNVFIVRDADDGEEIAKVLDFGIAKMQSAPGNPGMTSSTKTGAVLGTPFYMSPEQARGLRNVDHRTDIWSLGVIAFRCVTGRLPFDGESVGDLLVKICTGPVPVPTQTVPGIPPGFDGWFMRAMEREPERRFGTVMELANELCYVAGIAVPGAGAPLSHQQTVGIGGANPNAAILTPNGMMRSNAPPMTTPSPGMGSSPNNMASAVPNMGSSPNVYGQQPASITSSPLTSERAPGVPSGGSGKIIGIVAGAVVLIAAVGGGAFYAMRRNQPKAPDIVAATSSIPSAAVSSIPSASAATVASAPASVTTPATSVATSTDPAPTAKADPTTHKPGHHPGGTTKPAPSSVTVTFPPPAPAPAPAPKPNKNDPGY